MDTPVICPQCHIEVRQTDYFCSNCGKNLQEKPLVVSITTQTKLYLGSIFLPPMGIIWGLRYLRQKDQNSKIVGWVAIALTMVTLLVSIKLTMDFINDVNRQVEEQLENMDAF